VNGEPEHSFDLPKSATSNRRHGMPDVLDAECGWNAPIFEGI